ncbi:hypothetical protein N431DRAFT_553371 [Stipitochalara longipes BDJ]|nr:hypothetical protein N431DRAFT_553371 [Stipitochalara longipes BDJ]
MDDLARRLLPPAPVLIRWPKQMDAGCWLLGKSSTASLRKAWHAEWSRGAGQVIQYCLFRTPIDLADAPAPRLFMLVCQSHLCEWSPSARTAALLHLSAPLCTSLQPTLSWAEHWKMAKARSHYCHFLCGKFCAATAKCGLGPVLSVLELLCATSPNAVGMSLRPVRSGRCKGPVMRSQGSRRAGKPPSD